MKILVAGAGYVGTALLGQLTPHHECWGIRRRRQESDPENILIGDASTGDGLSDLPQEVSQIAIAIAPGARTDDAYRRAYPLVLTTLSRCFPRARLLLVSSSTVYAQQGGQTITEASPAESDSFSATRIREAEDLCLAHGNGSAVIRASGIYGPGRTRLVTRLAAQTPTGVEAQAMTNRIHRDDLASILAFLIERPELGGLFIASDEEPATMGQMSAWLHEHPLHDRLTPPPDAPAGRETRAPRKDRRLVPERLLAAGFSFKYPSFREGYDAILRGLPEGGP